METNNQIHENKTKVSIIAKAGPYGGFVLGSKDRNFGLLKEKLKEGDRLQGYICVALLGIYDHKLDNYKWFRELYEKYRGSGILGYAKVRAEFIVKKVNDNYIVFDVNSVEQQPYEIVEYKVIDSTYSRYANVEEFAFEILKKGLVSTKEEALKRIIKDSNFKATLYFLDREADPIIKLFGELDYELAYIEIEIEGDMKENELINELRKLVEKYGKEAIRKALELI